MKFTESDKAFLKELGYSANDLWQIEKASKKTYYKHDGKRIGLNKVVELLGRKGFLSGLARSAFHWTACRETPDGRFVYFDSSLFFKQFGENA